MAGWRAAAGGEGAGGEGAARAFAGSRPERGQAPACPASGEGWPGESRPLAQGGARTGEAIRGARSGRDECGGIGRAGPAGRSECPRQERPQGSPGSGRRRRASVSGRPASGSHQAQCRRHVSPSPRGGAGRAGGRVGAVPPG